jgi:hypothetical protein
MIKELHNACGVCWQEDKVEVSQIDDLEAMLFVNLCVSQDVRWSSV